MANTDPADGATPSPLRQALREIVDPFRSLAHSPRALWGVYVSYLLEGLVYFGIITILGKYLSENVGLSDLHAGWVYSGFTGGITLAMLFLGGIADRIGIRRALLLSLGILVVGRALIAASGFQASGGGSSSLMFIVVLVGLFVVVVGYGTYQPASYAAVKRFTNEKTASMGYAMIYGLMNLGAFFSGLISPPIRKAMGIEYVYLIYAGLTLLALLTVQFVLTRRVVERDSLTQIDRKPRADGPAAKRPASLMTPRFVILLAATLLSVGILLATFMTSRPAPDRVAASAATAALADAADAVVAGDGPARATALREAAGEIRRQLPAIEAGPGRTTPSSRAVAFTLENDAATLDALAAAPLALTEQRGDPDLLVWRERLRELGLRYMAAAYARVDPVDAMVLDNLRARMKTPDEPVLPLSPNARAEILAMASRDASSMLGDLREVTARAAATPDVDDPELAAVLTTIIAGDGRWLESATGDGPLVQARLLSSSLLYLRELPALLVRAADKDAETTVTGADLVAAWCGNRAGFADALESELAGAVPVPFGTRLGKWATKYGVWVLLALVAVTLLVRHLLAKRPEHPFHDRRFVFFIFVLIPVQTLFAHNWLTLPYYIDRAFGGTSVGENFEFFSNINPLAIFFLAPIVAALTAKAKVYRMMIIGTLVMALPTFLLSIAVNPVLLVTYILLMSVGEAMWQPRFLQWVAEIAPEGQTGSYMGIGQFPWFLTKVVTGLYSGAFLAEYCPIVGPQNTQVLWIWYGLIAMISPIALIMARKWMTKGEGGL